MQYIENGEVVSHKGIDVSKYQGNIDWPAVASDGVEYAFVRLGLRGYGSGKLVLDEYFDQNMRGAKDAEIKTGVYFFTQAITVEEAIEEADYVLENITGYDVSYPIVFDVEMITNDDGRANDLSQKDRTDIAIAFCDRIKAAGYTPMIYGNVKCFTKLLDMTRLNDYEKWYAFYDDYMYMPYEVGIWQYTEKGKVAGINTGVDLNISYKEY
ncbi:MAG: glycoside hydrolase family 25 protein, partial [Lachnospiraceae bacterium]|nr:glycoside hydrolase family 25 protein [Lachnospiraceae bacterium]